MSKTELGHGSESPTAKLADTILSADVVPGTEPTIISGAATIAHEPPQLATVSPDSYARGSEIARGGMGRIVEARDRRLGREVALKELLHSGGDARARFEREALITARLQHPAIVAIYEAGRWPDGEPFYAMKRVAGQSLDKVVATARALDERLALIPRVVAVFDALAYAHRHRVIHRDLKPANVLVGEFGETVVIDWGLAKDLADAAMVDDDRGGPFRTSATDATMVGAVMGTPSYMPPEQARGARVDERADVYSLGALLYHVLSGTAPFTGRTVDDILTAVLSREPTPLAELVPGVPRDLADLVAKAMARDPAARYPTAEALADDLRRFQTGQLVGAHAYSPIELVRRWLRRHRAPVTVAAVLVAAATIALGFAFRAIAEQRDRAEDGEAAATTARDDARAERDNTVVESARGALAIDPARALATLAKLPVDAAELTTRRAWLIAAAVAPAHVARAIYDVGGDGYAELAVDDAGDVISLASSGAVEVLHDGVITTLPFHVVTATAAWTVDQRYLAWIDHRAVMVWERGAPAPKALANVFVTDDTRLHAVTGSWIAITAPVAGSQFDNDRCTVHVDLHAPDQHRPCAASQYTFDQDTHELAAVDPDGHRHTLVLEPTVFPSGRMIVTNDDRSFAVRTALGGVVIGDVELTHVRSYAIEGAYEFEIPRASADSSHMTMLGPRQVYVADFASGGLAGIDVHDASSLGMTADARAVALGTTGDLWIADTASRAAVVWRHAHPGRISSLAFGPSARTLATQGDDRQVRVFDVVPPGGTSTPVVGETVTFEPAAGDATLLVTRPSDDATVLDVAVDSADHARDRHVQIEMPSRLGRLALSPDGTRVANLERSGLIVGDLAGHADDPIEPPEQHHAPAAREDITSTVAFSPDGTRVLSAVAGGDGALWDLRARSAVAIPAAVLAVAWLPDGQRAAVLTGDDLRVVDLRGATIATVAIPQATGCEALAVSRDGGEVAAGCEHGAYVLDVATGARRDLATPDPVLAVAFGPTGELATGGVRARLWPRGATVPSVLVGNDSEIDQLAWSDDGRVLQAHAHGQTWLWDPDASPAGVELLVGDDEYIWATPALTPALSRTRLGVNTYELPPRDPAGLHAWLARRAPRSVH
nr:serine/threonine-protein kinase [Kofleriaceae bacterium]